MRQIRDTFLHYLSDNLPESMPVHALRVDPLDAAAGLLAMNSINVQFLGMRLDTLGKQQAVVEVVNDDENTAADWMWCVWKLLRSSFYTPLFDYTNPSFPKSEVGNVFWDHNSVNFMRVANTTYVHYSCTFQLRFNAAS